MNRTLFRWVSLSMMCTLVVGCRQNEHHVAENTERPITAKPIHSPVEPAASQRSAAKGPVETNLRFESAAEFGLRFTHTAGRSEQKWVPETMGGGVLVADFNRDAAPDVLFLNSGRILDDQRIESAPHQLFINDGAGTFADETRRWHLVNSGYGMGGAVGDFDNDGWPDLYLTTFNGQDRLLRNTGKQFEDVTDHAGIKSRGWSTSAGFFDLENDGDLDLFVVKYVDYPLDAVIPCYLRGFMVYCTPEVFDACPDQLFRNNGDGTFTDFTKSANIPPDGKGLAVVIGDIDDDGDADIYVANDTTANALLINSGSGAMDDQASLLGVGYNRFGQAQSGMGADLSDVNEDGFADIVCTNFQGQTSSLYVQQPQGYFIERSDALGVSEAARARLSFGIDFFDADNDGDEDLLVANGHIYVDVGEFQSGVEFEQANTIYEKRDGRFVDVTPAAGPALQTKAAGRGLATSDLDADGDIDFIVVNSNSTAEVVRNTTKMAGNSILLWLEGAKCNRSAIGAVVEATVGDRKMSREVIGVSSYLSACDQRLHFGLGDASQIDELKIRWPGGSEQSIGALPAGGTYHIIEGSQPVLVKPGESVIAP